MSLVLVSNTVLHSTSEVQHHNNEPRKREKKKTEEVITRMHKNTKEKYSE